MKGPTLTKESGFGRYMFSHFHEISYPIAIRSIKINRTIVDTGHILNCYVMYEYATHIEGLVEP